VFLAEGKQIKHHAEEQELAATATPART